MPPTLVSKGLQALLDQQKKQEQKLKTRYDHDQAKEDQRWQMRALWQRQNYHLESSMGAAARQVRFTDPESYAKEVYAAAAGSGANPAQRTADNTFNMLSVLEQIRDRLGMGSGAGSAADAASGGGASAIAGAARANWLGLGAGSLGGG